MYFASAKKKFYKRERADKMSKNGLDLLIHFTQLTMVISRSIATNTGHHTATTVAAAKMQKIQYTALST